MPYKKKKTKFRTDRRRIKTIARQGNITYQMPYNVPRGVNVGKHFFKQIYRPSATALTLNTGSGGSYDPLNGLLLGPTSAASADLNGSLYFQLSDLPQSASFASLFDAYKISKVVVSFEPIQNMMGSASLSTPANNISEPLTTVIDRDDNNLLTAMSQYEEYESYKRTPGYKKHVRTLVPAVAASVYKSTGTTIAYQQKYKQWIDMADTNVPHYGIKFLVPTLSVAANNYRCGWFVRVKAYIGCKQVR